MPELMSQKDFAARHKVSKPAVSGWKAKGLLVFAPDPDRPGKFLVDAEKSDLLVRGSIDQTRGRPRTAERAQAEDGADPAATPAAAPPGRMSSLEAARLDEMQERTRRRRIETEQLLGRLVDASEFERRAGEMGRKCREGVHGVVRQLAERLAAIGEPREVISVLGEAVDQVFNRLADEIEAEAAAEREVDAQLAPLADEDDAELDA